MTSAENTGRVCAPRRNETTHHGYGLPSDFMDKAVARLGWLGLLFAATLHLVHWTRVAFTPLEEALGPSNIASVGLIAGTVLGLGICALAWSKKVRPCLMLDLGLLFQVAASFAIAALESRIHLHSMEPLVGVSGIALWITFFVLVVPVSTGKAALGAIGSALMGPLALLVYVAFNQLPLPNGTRILSIFLPDLLAAAWSLILARYIYGMGQALGKARQMGYYELTERVGSGGMGEVWRARHRMLARPAAIKLISPESLGAQRDLNSTLIRRFEREAQATAMLQSPHTIQLYDFGVTDDGSLYYAMEYLDGLDMQSLIETYGPVPPERAVHFMLQILESLEEAHQAGVVHRDIKPSNIFVGKHGLKHDFVKVLDFGLARISANDDASLTMPSLAAGTPAYMSPEAALGDANVDGRSDLYAVGAVGYWLLTGRNVFEGSTPYATVMEHLHSEPVPPSRRSESEIPVLLDEIILSALAKDPLRRPQTAGEMAARLSAIVSAEPWTSGRAEHWWRVHRPITTRLSKSEVAGAAA